uniref:Secreted protein n=1 Tax=Haemonchus placei TaxID=6290 RepID=A0A0N4VZ65_HAEPC
LDIYSNSHPGQVVPVVLLCLVGQVLQAYQVILVVPVVQPHRHFHVDHHVQDIQQVLSVLVVLVLLCLPLVPCLHEYHLYPELLVHPPSQAYHSRQECQAGQDILLCLVHRLVPQVLELLLLLLVQAHQVVLLDHEVHVGRHGSPAAEVIKEMSYDSLRAVRLR